MSKVLIINTTRKAFFSAQGSARKEAAEVARFVAHFQQRLFRPEAEADTKTSKGFTASAHSSHFRFKLAEKRDGRGGPFAHRFRVVSCYFLCL